MPAPPCRPICSTERTTFPAVRQFSKRLATPPPWEIPLQTTAPLICQTHQHGTQPPLGQTRGHIQGVGPSLCNTKRDRQWGEPGIMPELRACPTRGCVKAPPRRGRHVPARRRHAEGSCDQAASCPQKRAKKSHSLAKHTDTGYADRLAFPLKGALQKVGYEQIAKARVGVC